MFYNGYDTHATLDVEDIVPLPRTAHLHDKRRGELRNYLVREPLLSAVGVIALVYPNQP